MVALHDSVPLERLLFPTLCVHCHEDILDAAARVSLFSPALTLVLRLVHFQCQEVVPMSTRGNLGEQMNRDNMGSHSSRHCEITHR
jgi:hypothetical protein